MVSEPPIILPQQNKANVKVPYKDESCGAVLEQLHVWCSYFVPTHCTVKNSLIFLLSFAFISKAICMQNEKIKLDFLVPIGLCLNFYVQTKNKEKV